ncbi:MAG: glycerophosphodiester phosphodiesterase [Micropruina sp.]|nr:glycerophosphodiester phosphodiesterase [Micropruina sp.]
MRADDYPYFRTRFAALAHRGGQVNGDPARENSLAAFQHAVAQGYRYLETDVHTSADGVLLAFHDTHLDRVTDASGALAALPHSEIARARIAGSDSIPTLDELLDAFPTARFNIDLKADSAIVALARVLDRHRAHDRVCVGSFSQRRIQAFRRLTGRRVATSVGPVGVAVYGYAAAVRRLVRSPGVALQIPVRIRRDTVRLLSPGLIRAAHAAGRVVHVWTVNDEPTMHDLIDLGVDGIVTDATDVLKRVLLARGLWEDER